MGEPSISSPLEATACWTAAVRAQETAREAGLIDDPWAEELAGPEGRAWIEARTPDGALPIVVRTRYFDDWLERLMLDPSIRQFVLLGAGLDTRAFRLGWPDGATVYELDRSSTLLRKDDVLGRAGTVPRCIRRVVQADVTAAWPAALVAAGFDVDRPSAWLVEGLLFYLASEELGRVLDDITSLSVTGSHLGFDIVNAAMLTSEWTRAWVEMQAAAGAPWLGTMEDPVAALAAWGWIAALTQAGQPDADYGRWTLPVLPTTMPGVPHDWFVTAVRREGPATQ